MDEAAFCKMDPFPSLEFQTVDKVHKRSDSGSPL
jgi:hypothetical protein